MHRVKSAALDTDIGKQGEWKEPNKWLNTLKKVKFREDWEIVVWVGRG